MEWEPNITVLSNKWDSLKRGPNVRRVSKHEETCRPYTLTDNGKWQLLIKEGRWGGRGIFDELLMALYFFNEK